MNNIEQIDNNDALNEDAKDRDPNEALLDEIEDNKKDDPKPTEGELPSDEEQEGDKKDIKEDMVDVTDPTKTNGAYTENKAFSTGDYGNTFEYEDTAKRAEDYKDAVERKEQNIDSAVQTVDGAEDELEAIKKKEAEVKTDTQEIPQEEAVPVAENPIPEGEEENVQMDAVDADHKSEVLAFRQEEENIDNETAEKLNTFAA